jgi:hypothetical protein
MTNARRHPVQRKQLILLMLFCGVLVAAPFFLVQFIPSTDLPQHLAQIRLLQEVLKAPHQDTYTVEWLGANTLVYYLLQLNWIVFQPVFAGKMTVLEIALAWVVSIFALAHRKRRSLYSASLACVFIFNAGLYWGFLNFLIGFPIFVLWYFTIIDNEKKRSAFGQITAIAGMSFLLFLAHALWLLVGLFLLAVAAIYRRSGIKEILVKVVALAPIGIYGIYWFPKLAAIRTQLHFDTAAHWITSPWERVLPHTLTDSLLGGLRGPTEALVLTGIAVWIGLSVATNRRQIKKSIDKEFLFIGILLASVVLFAPEKYVNTIYFASRWAPIAMIFFLLALPQPRLKESIVFAGAILSITILSFTTCFFWTRFEKYEISGLDESLKKITENARVIGLDFVQNSELICGRPFLQTFSYAQVLHGGGLNFSFAEHHSGILSFAHIDTVYYWTQGLEWRPERVRIRDFSRFDYALINGKEDIHRIFSSLPVLTPITTKNRWRLYRCGNDSFALRKVK